MNKTLIALCAVLAGAASGCTETRMPSGPTAGELDPSATPAAGPITPRARDYPATEAATTSDDPEATQHFRNPPPPNDARTDRSDAASPMGSDARPPVTPMDQGNSTSELAITAAIRKGILGEKTFLSFAAKNVMVVTVGNRVTLRGTVKTAQEKATIEAIAWRTTGVNEIDNQIEVGN